MPFAFVKFVIYVASNIDIAAQFKNILEALVMLLVFVNVHFLNAEQFVNMLFPFVIADGRSPIPASFLHPLNRARPLFVPYCALVISVGVKSNL